jgi:hypothetical protein
VRYLQLKALLCCGGFVLVQQARGVGPVLLPRVEELHALLLLFGQSLPNGILRCLPLFLRLGPACQHAFHVRIFFGAHASQLASGGIRYHRAERFRGHGRWRDVFLAGL